VNTNALQIFFYFDEVECCNPIGSKAKIHKLGTYMIYMKLMYLFCLCFPTGAFYFTVGNLSPLYRSRLLSIAIISADNLGSLALGGFKESCRALRMCRHA